MQRIRFCCGKAERRMQGHLLPRSLTPTPLSSWLFVLTRFQSDIANGCTLYSMEMLMKFQVVVLGAAH